MNLSFHSEEIMRRGDGAVQESHWPRPGGGRGGAYGRSRSGEKVNNMRCCLSMCCALCVCVWCVCVCVCVVHCVCVCGVCVCVCVKDGTVWSTSGPRVAV